MSLQPEPQSLSIRSLLIHEQVAAEHRITLAPWTDEIKLLEAVPDSGGRGSAVIRTFQSTTQIRTTF
jgi:hypothetical protein